MLVKSKTIMNDSNITMQLQEHNKAYKRFNVIEKKLINPLI